MNTFRNICAFLFIIASYCISVNASAQCTPSLAGPFGSIVPDTTDNLPSAQVGVSYQSEIQFFVPQDTILPPATPVTIQDFQITSITGLPPGFTYTTNPSNGIIPGGSAGCARFVGPPPALADTGVYPLTVYLTIHIAPFGFGTMDTINGYEIVVMPSTSSNGLSYKSEEVKIVPLENGSSLLAINSIKGGKANLKIYNVLGQELFVTQMIMDPGHSELELPQFTGGTGIFIFLLETEHRNFSGKFIQTKRRN